MLTLINSFNVLRLDNFLLRTTRIVANKITKLTGLNNFQISSLCMLLAIPAMYIGTTSVDYIHRIPEFTSSQVLETKSSLMIVMLFFVLLVSALNWLNERSCKKGNGVIELMPTNRYFCVFISIFGILMNIMIWYLLKEFSLVHYFFAVLISALTMSAYLTDSKGNFVIYDKIHNV